LFSIKIVLKYYASRISVWYNRGKKAGREEMTDRKLKELKRRKGIKYTPPKEGTDVETLRTLLRNVPKAKKPIELDRPSREK